MAAAVSAPSRRRIWLILLSLLVLVAGAAIVWRARAARPAGAPPASARANVLLVTIDTLRADRAAGAVMPALAALAARGAAFEGARSVAPLTLPAHASLMTGLLPPRTGVRLNGQRLPSDLQPLATVLRRAGYRTAAFVGAYVLDRRFGLSAGFQTYDDEIARGDESAGSLEAERPGDIVAGRAIAWLRDAASRPDPFLLWVHLYDPHAPYRPPDPWRARADRSPYDGEVAFADAQLGRLLASLAQLGLGDRTLTVVAGDHGESLGDHGEDTHGLLLYDAALRVPLVMAGPGIPTVRRTEAVSLVDVWPTMAARLGLPAPPALDGRDLFGSGPVPRDGDVYAETLYPESAGCSPLFALVSDRWKLIDGPAVPELYDLDRDREERADLRDGRPSVVVAMQTRVRQLREREARAPAAAITADASERLRALGYVSATPAAPTPRAGPDVRPSPTTVVRDWGRLEAALTAMAAGQSAEAVATLADLARSRPEARVFQASYARALSESGDARRAVAVYRAALRRWPQDTDLLHGLAGAARDAGLAAEAVKAEEAVLALDATHAAAHNGLGLLLADAGRADRAVPAFERAVALDPHAVSYWFNLGNARMANGDMPGAEAAYRAALRLDAASADGANGLGVVLVRTGRAREAIPVFERVLAASPGFVDAWLNLGIAWQEAGDPARAADAYRKVLSLDRRSLAQERAAAALLESLGRPAR